MNSIIKISDYDYPLPEERIAKFPLEQRNLSKLLIYKEGEICHKHFSNLGTIVPKGAMLVFNNTKVIRARIIMHKPSGARIEVFCLEPYSPADYERAFAATGSCAWRCIVGNSKKWKDGAVEINFEYDGQPTKLSAYRDTSNTEEHIVRFEWNCELTFGQLLEHLGRIPIPPYLNRESEDIDNIRYQTVYSKFEGSVAAPTAGLHFSAEQIERMKNGGTQFDEVTLHVGAGTFLPVKCDNVTEHHMHTEHFEITITNLDNLIAKQGSIVAVGTTTVRTLESIVALGYRALTTGDAQPEKTVGQWELYDIPKETETLEILNALRKYITDRSLTKIKTSTGIMIIPGFGFRIVNHIITNFHQPKSTLLLLVSAFIGEDWHKVYRYALDNDFRFLSYGDSSILIGKEQKL